MDKKFLFGLVGVTGIILKSIVIYQYYPLCKKYPNNYDLGREIRKLSIPNKKKSFPNDYDLGSHTRKLVNQVFRIY
jgi:hypothetical protein